MGEYVRETQDPDEVDPERVLVHFDDARDLVIITDQTGHSIIIDSENAELQQLINVLQNHLTQPLTNPTV